MRTSVPRVKRAEPRPRYLQPGKIFKELLTWESITFDAAIRD